MDEDEEIIDETPGEQVEKKDVYRCRCDQYNPADPDAVNFWCPRHGHIARV